MTYEVAVTIADGQTVSGAVQINDVYELRPKAILGIRSAANLTTADVTFQESNDNSTYTAVKNAGGAAVTVSSLAASEYRRLSPADSVGVRWVKVVSSAAQSGGDTLYLVVGTV